MGKTPQDTKPSACVRVCVFICPPPLRPPSLQSLSPSSLSRVPSPTTAFAPRPLPLSPPFLLKTREAPEDRLGQVAQLIAAQREVPVGTHVVENTIFQCIDTLVAEDQMSRLFGAGACAVQDAAGVCEKTAGAEGTRQS